MVVREPMQQLTYDGDIIDNPICCYNGQDVELVYDSNNGEWDIKEDLINLNVGDQIMVKGILKVEPVNVKGMLAFRSSLTVEDIEDVSEQVDESGSDYGSGHDDETSTDEYHRHNTSTTDNHIIAQHPGRSGHNDSYHNNFNTNNLNFSRAGQDDGYHSTSNAYKRSIAYHPYRSVHIDPVHEMGVNHRGRSIKRPGTPYPKANSKQHHRGMSTPRFGSNSVIGHQEVVYYRHDHAKVFGLAENQVLVSRQSK